ALYAVILKQSTAWAISMASAQEIDQINILQASLLAMRRAVLHLSIQPSLVQVDGNQTPNLPHACQAIIGGDGKIAEISAASILAKVYRDWLMQVISATYPGYEFSKHEGYGTALHLQKLKELGACIEHRASFSPVKKLLTLAHT
ncbi:MAG: ribonuclease HII, partial [Gammaproteobacteria bacterium]|nr:ribonuclease HII [Gammaproteobacteria bacterium]